MTADEAVKARAPQGVSEHDMTPGWRVIVARRGEEVRTWYHHINDDPRLIAMHRARAAEVARAGQ